MKRHILIDPGHGGKDSGATGKKSREKDITLSVAKMLYGILEVTFPFIPHLTRKEDEYVKLSDRVQMARELNPDLFISLHCNSFPEPTPNDTQIYYYRPKDVTVGKIFFKHLNRINDKTSRWSGVRVGNFYVLRLAEWPALLIEMGFLSNPEDEDWLIREDNHIKMAGAILNALIDWHFAQIERLV